MLATFLMSNTARIGLQRSPRAFTPSNSVEFGDLFADEVKKEHPPIPAQLNFVTSLNQGDSDVSSFTVNTGAAIDTIPALPMRVSPGPVSSPGGLDELELLHMESSPTSPHIDTFFEDRIDTLLEDEEIALRMAQVHRSARPRPLYTPFPFIGTKSIYRGLRDYLQIHDALHLCQVHRV